MIKLKRMSKKEYKVFIKKSIKRFAKEQIKRGYWHKDEALKKVKFQYKRNLGKGIKESKYYFYIVCNKVDKKVGYLWLMSLEKEKMLFIAEIYMRKKYRHQGYGRATLKKVEKVAKTLNYNKIGLDVAIYNDIAKSLYSQLGFNAISEFRIKRI